MLWIYSIFEKNFEYELDKHCVLNHKGKITIAMKFYFSSFHLVTHLFPFSLAFGCITNIRSQQIISINGLRTSCSVSYIWFIFLIIIHTGYQIYMCNTTRNKYHSFEQLLNLKRWSKPSHSGTLAAKLVIINSHNQLRGVLWPLMELEVGEDQEKLSSGTFKGFTELLNLFCPVSNGWLLWAGGRIKARTSFAVAAPCSFHYGTEVVDELQESLECIADHLVVEEALRSDGHQEVVVGASQVLIVTSLPNLLNQLPVLWFQHINL